MGRMALTTTPLLLLPAEVGAGRTGLVRLIATGLQASLCQSPVTMPSLLVALSPCRCDADDQEGQKNEGPSIDAATKCMQPGASWNAGTRNFLKGLEIEGKDRAFLAHPLARSRARLRAAETSYRVHLHYSSCLRSF